MGWGCAFLIALIPVGIFLRGLMLQWLWFWFVVPFGVVALTLPWALGLSAVAYAFTGSSSSDSEDEDPATAMFKAGFLMVGNPLLGLCFGWLIHLWM
jgi:hypothetical protein